MENIENGFKEKNLMKNKFGLSNTDLEVIISILRSLL